MVLIRQKSVVHGAVIRGFLGHFPPTYKCWHYYGIEALSCSGLMQGFQHQSVSNEILVDKVVACGKSTRPENRCVRTEVAHGRQFMHEPGLHLQDNYSWKMIVDGSWL